MNDAAFVRIRAADGELLEALRGYLDGPYLFCRLLNSADPVFLQVLPLKNNDDQPPLELLLPVGSVLCIGTGRQERIAGFVASAQASQQPPAAGASDQVG